MEAAMEKDKTTQKTDNQPETENQIGNIHLENYDAKYNLRNLNHHTMIYTHNRPHESLNGLWHFAIDPYDTGLRGNWNILDQKDGAGNRIPWDYDCDGGAEIPVPFCWNLFKPELFHYEGSAWYSRRFPYRPEFKDERVFLRIGAANYDTKVYLNQEFLGNHYGGSTPFYVELTGKLTPENLIQICVNNTRTLDRVPMRNTDWFNYGGIYRDIELFRVKPDFIKDFFIYLVPDNSYQTLKVFIEVDKPVSGESITLSIPELQIKKNVKPRDGKCEFEITARPKLWSLDDPKLYEVFVQYKDDQITDRVGFRQISVSGTKIFLNGQELFLRGICVHEDDAKLGKVSDENDIRRRFADAGDLGCNYVRLAHYPHHELAAKIADEIGILLWEEIPVYWAIDFGNETTYQDAENQFSELIKRDRNRASVIIWSVGNENADSDDRLTFMSNLAKTAKIWDPSRLVSAACLVNHKKIKIEDRLTEYLDVIGLNEYYGWYYPDFDDLITLGKNSNPDKPVLISETGADALAGFHSSKTDLFSEEYMAEVYLKQIAIIEKLDYVRGISPWILYDFRTPRRQNKYQKGFNRKGLIAADKKTRKMAFYILREFYLKKAERNL
jgi:beta-glucuronidase